MQIKIINKKDMPRPLKIIENDSVTLNDGTVLKCMTVELNTPTAASKYNKGFAKLKRTKYYPLLWNWVLVVIK